MADDLAPIRARAAAHQVALDVQTRWLSPQHLAAMWGCSVSSVRAIPHEDLPYIELGRGRVLKRRRYHPDEVKAYEATGRRPNAGAA